MYSMLREEIQWANEEKEPYAFTHYLVLSKTYMEVASNLDAQDDRPAKKSKKAANGGAGEVFYFHPEDEVLGRYALGVCGFEYEKQRDEGSSDSKRAFQELGVKPQGHLVLIENDKFAEAVEAVREYLGSEAA
jgi:protein BCP1